VVEVVCFVCGRKEEEEEEEKEKENSICCCYLDTDLIGPICPKKNPSRKVNIIITIQLKYTQIIAHQSRSDPVPACTGSNGADLREQWHFEINSTIGHFLVSGLIE